MTRKSVAFISNRFVIVLLLGSLTLLGFSQYKQWQARKRVAQQIASLKAEAGAVEDKNRQLEDSLKYLSSTSATDRLAKEQMGLKKEGEIAVVFMPAKTTGQNSTQASQKSNAQLWWDYFFGNVN